LFSVCENSHERTVTDLVKRGADNFDKRLATAQRDIDRYKQMVMDLQSQMGTATSAIVINNINTKAKQSWLSLNDAMSKSHHDLTKMLNDSANHTDAAHRGFVEVKSHNYPHKSLGSVSSLFLSASHCSRI
jgi:hypothetical protein